MCYGGSDSRRQIKRSRVRFPHWNFFFFSTPFFFFFLNLTYLIFPPLFFLHARSAISILKHFSSTGHTTQVSLIMCESHSLQQNLTLTLMSYKISCIRISLSIIELTYFAIIMAEESCINSQESDQDA